MAKRKFSFLIFVSLQDEKNQILTTNAWLNLVSLSQEFFPFYFFKRQRENVNKLLNNLHFPVSFFIKCCIIHSRLN